MTKGTEFLMIDKWLVDTFSADTALMAALPDEADGLVSGAAEEGAGYPLVRWSVQSPPMVQRGVGTTEIWVNGLWLIRGVGQGASWNPLRPIAARIQALLDGKQNIVLSEGTINVCIREEAFRLPQVTGGRQYRSLGGIYRIIAQG